MVKKIAKGYRGKKLPKGKTAKGIAYATVKAKGIAKQKGKHIVLTEKGKKMGAGKGKGSTGGLRRNKNKGPCKKGGPGYGKGGGRGKGVGRKKK